MAALEARSVILERDEPSLPLRTVHGIVERYITRATSRSDATAAMLDKVVDALEQVALPMRDG